MQFYAFTNFMRLLTLIGNRCKVELLRVYCFGGLAESGLWHGFAKPGASKKRCAGSNPAPTATTIWYRANHKRLFLFALDLWNGAVE